MSCEIQVKFVGLNSQPPRDYGALWKARRQTFSHSGSSRLQRARNAGVRLTPPPRQKASLQMADRQTVR